MSTPRSHSGIQQSLCQRADKRVVGIVTQEHDVHVAVQAERQPTVAPDRDQRDAPPRFAAERPTGRVRSAVQSAQQSVDGSRMSVGSGDARVSPAHGVLERSAVSTEVPTTGLTERRCEPT